MRSPANDNHEAWAKVSKLQRETDRLIASSQAAYDSYAQQRLIEKLISDGRA